MKNKTKKEKNNGSINCRWIISFGNIWVFNFRINLWVGKMKTQFTDTEVEVMYRIMRDYMAEAETILSW